MELVAVPVACPQLRPTLLKMSHWSMGNQTRTEATKETSEHFAVTTRRCYWDNPHPLFQKCCPSWAILLWDVFPCLWHGPWWLAHPSWALEASVCS